MKPKTFLAIAFEIGFAGILAVAQTAAPPASPATGTPPAAKPAAPRPAVKKTPTQVDSVIQLAKGGMSEAFIIKYLQKNNKPAELTPTDIVKLKEAGVSETVIGVMMDPTSAPAPAAAPPPAEAPVPAPEPTPVVITPPPAPVSPDVQGDWRGNLTMGAIVLPIVLHLGPAGAGTADSPKQKALGMPLQYSVSGSQASITGPSVGGTYVATVNGTQMTGTYSQRGLNFPLTLALGGPAEAAAVPKAGKAVAGGDWKGALEDAIQQAYPLTQFTGDKTDIVTPGAVLMLKKNNLVMYAGDALATPNTYKGGKITQNFLGAIQRNATDGTVRIFVKGEKFWMSQLDVKDDGLYLQFISDPLPDSRYHGTLKFPWDKKTQPHAEEIAALVAEVLQNVGNPAAPAAQPAQQQMPQIQAPPPPPEQALPAIAPPPPPPATLEVGQTRDQVIAALGQPEKIANAGTKQILYFKNLKVTLVGGKVTVIE